MILDEIHDGEFFFVATDSAYCEDFGYTKDMLKEKYKEYMIERIDKIKKVLKDVDLFYSTGEKIIPDREGNINLKKDGDKLKIEFQRNNIKYRSYPCGWGDNRCAYFDICWKEVLTKMKEFNYYIDGEFIE